MASSKELTRLKPLTFAAPVDVIQRFALLAASENEMPSKYWRLALRRVVERFAEMSAAERRALVEEALDGRRAEDLTLAQESGKVNVRVPARDLELVREVADVLNVSVAQLVRESALELVDEFVPPSDVDRLRSDTLERFERRLALFQEVEATDAVS